MNRSFVNSGRLLTILFLLLFASQAFGAAGEVLEVNGREIIIEGDADELWQVNDELEIVDYDNKKVARVQIKEVITNANSTEYLCRVITGSSDIRIGYGSKHNIKDWGDLYLELSALNLGISQNPQYNQVTGLAPASDYGQQYVVRFGYLLAAERKDKNSFGNLSASYTDFGPYSILDVFEFGLKYNFPIKRGKVTAALWGFGGIGFAFGEMKWARPAGTYEDNIGRDSGEAKKGGSPVYTAQASTSITYQLASNVGLQFQVGYLRIFRGQLVDTEKPSDEDKDSWKIEEEWLETDIANHGITMGMSVLISLF